MKSELTKLIDTHDIISFDVFDTLVHRLTPHAWSVPRLVELKLRHHPLTKTYPFLGTSFADARRKAERVSRQEREKFEGDTESNFNEIYEIMQELLGVPKKVILELQALEIEMESKVLYADPLMKEMFDYAKKQNKKVVICSDMYLPGAILGKLLERCGYDLQDVPVNVSCDYRESKYRGGLFSCLPKGNVVHIGDNEHSDVRMARQYGLDAYFYDYGYKIPSSFSYSTSLTQSIIDGVVTKKALEKEGSFSPLELIGLQTYGPFLAGFLIWFLSKIEGKKYDRILFFARDSFMFFETIEEHLKDIELAGERIFTKLPPIDYVRISRAAITLPTLYDMDASKLQRMMRGRGSRSVREWLKLYNIYNPSLVTGDILAAGFASEEDVIPGEDPRFANLLQRIYLFIIESSKVAREEALKYFNQFPGKNIAIVDLGWSGSLQQGLSKLLLEVDPSIKTDGYYFHLWNLPDYSRESLHDNFYAYLRDHSEELYANLPKLIAEGGIELLEDVLSDQNGTTLGYYDKEPILEEACASLDLKDLQGMAIEFFNTLLPLLRTVPLSSLDSLEWTRPLFRMVEFPTKQEVEILGEIRHSDVAGATASSLNFLAPKLDEVSCGDKRLYIKAEATAYWKQGFKLRNKPTYGKHNKAKK